MLVTEIILLIVILLLLGILIYYSFLIKLAKKIHSDFKYSDCQLFSFIIWIYNTFKKIRRFSLVYIFRNRFYKLYLAIAIAVVAVKIIVYYYPQAQQTLPLWLNKSTDFLIVSAAWEIICIITKTIEEKTNIK